MENNYNIYSFWEMERLLKFLIPRIDNELTMNYWLNNVPDDNMNANQNAKILGNK